MSPLAPDRLTFRAMGSEISLVIEPTAGADPPPLGEVPGWFRAWESCLSRFVPHSELSRLNRSPGVGVCVDRTLWEVLQAACAAAEATDGLITPTLLRQLEAAGYDRSFELVEASQVSQGDQPTASTVDFRDIDFDEARQVVTLPPGLQLDLGGTGKGWAADQAAARLARFGSTQVNAGGDLSMSGPRPGGLPWAIAVASPLVRDEVLGVLELERGGVATSARSYRRWQRGGAWQHHLIDPRTGRPALTDVVSATVVGPSALVAEVAAKHVLILGGRVGLEWLEGQPALAALVVLEDGSVMESKRIGQYWSAGLSL